LERNGFLVEPSGHQQILIIKTGNQIFWQFNTHQYASLHSLLAELIKT
jgi:hypothetical protein